MFLEFGIELGAPNEIYIYKYKQYQFAFQKFAKWTEVGFLIIGIRHSLAFH